MSVKPPRGVSTRTDTDVHTPPTRNSDKDFSKADIPHRDGMAPWVRVDDSKLPGTSLGDAAGGDAVLPMTTVEVHPEPPIAAIPPVIQRSLESYLIRSAAVLPDADGEGFRVHKDRRYVEVADGGLVLVGADPETGWYRARLPSELLPSGPWMLRDIESGLWHPHSDFNANTVPLTDASLQVFRAGLDFSVGEPGSDGLFRHDGKLYVVIHDQAYQVTQDLDVSSPNYKVWRLVNPKDPVATDSANIYRASRSGETRAITRNEQGFWVSILTGLRGGMDRNDPAQVNMTNFHRPWLTRNVGTSGGQPPVVVATTRAQVQRYLPDSTDQHADDFIARFGEMADAEVELKRIQLEFPQFNREVSAWEVAYKGKVSEERNRRLTIGAKMRRLYKWQGETSEKVYRDGRLAGFKLELELGRRGNLALPAFPARLNSVVSLGLEGTTSNNLGHLFSMFSHVETLELRSFKGKAGELLAALDKLPQLKVLDIQRSWLWLQSIGQEHFTRLTRLQELSLTNCSLWPRVSVRGMTELRVLRIRSCDLYGLPDGLPDVAPRLQVLDLHHNPNVSDAPDVTRMSELRVLDLSYTGISLPPAGLGSPGGPLRLEVLNFSHSYSLVTPPSLRGMTALRELDLGNTRVNRFPEGVTSEIPGSHLNMAYSAIVSIPENIELRKGFDLSNTPISDPASLRRLIAARRQTGTDVWLGRARIDLGINHWLHNVPQEQHTGRVALWHSLANQTNATMMEQISNLVRTPEFQVERQLLQRRVWSFLEHFQKASLGEQESLRDIAAAEPSPGTMLDRLEEEMKKFDPTWQHQPPHHLPKRPRLE